MLKSYKKIAPSQNLRGPVAQNSTPAPHVLPSGANWDQSIYAEHNAPSKFTAQLPTTAPPHVLPPGEHALTEDEAAHLKDMEALLTPPVAVSFATRWPTRAEASVAVGGDEPTVPPPMTDISNVENYDADYSIFGTPHRSGRLPRTLRRLRKSGARALEAAQKMRGRTRQADELRQDDLSDRLAEQVHPRQADELWQDNLRALSAKQEKERKAQGPAQRDFVTQGFEVPTSVKDLYRKPPGYVELGGGGKWKKRNTKKRNTKKRNTKKKKRNPKKIKSKIRKSKVKKSKRRTYIKRN